MKTEAAVIEAASVDQLGSLLAQIADLQKKADGIKNAIKDSASAGGAKSIEGSLFRATYSETDRSVFDKAAFVDYFGIEAYERFTKTTAVFSVKVTSR